MAPLGRDLSSTSRRRARIARNLPSPQESPGLQFDPARLEGHLDAALASCSEQTTMCGVNFLDRRPVPGLVPALGDLGFTEFHGYTRAVLALPGASFVDYVASIGSRKRRWNVRRERRLFEESGQRIEVSQGSAAMAEDIVTLQGMNKAKYDQAFDAEETRRRYSDLLGSAGPDGIVVRSLDGTTCTGFAMFFRGGDTLHSLSAGFVETDAAIGPYFECLFYAAIDWACEHGVREIDYGIGSAFAKAARGCDLLDVATWHRR